MFALKLLSDFTMYCLIIFPSFYTFVQLEKTRNECRIKDESIRKLEDNLQNLEGKAKGKDHIHKNLQEKIKELEGQIESKTAMQNQSQRLLSQLSDKLRGKEETCGTLQHKV